MGLTDRLPLFWHVIFFSDAHATTRGKDGGSQLAKYEVLAHGSVGLIMYVLSRQFSRP
jgi:hypothetical protein